MPDEIKLDRVFLLPAFQNPGIGTRLIEQVVSEARSAGLPPFGKAQSSSQQRSE